MAFSILVVSWWWAASLSAATDNAKTHSHNTIAFFYGHELPLAEANFYDRIVLQPELVADWQLSWLKARDTAPYAYLSIGETLSSSAPGHRLTRNRAWQSAVMDLTDQRWQKHLYAQAAKLLDAGYQGLFLDTLDSHRLAGEKDEQEQLRSLTQIISRLSEITGNRLILNRGFNVLSQLQGKAESVVAEGLFSHYQPQQQRYGVTTTQAQAWLTARLKEAQSLGFHVQVLDYAEQQSQRQALIGRIHRAGFDGWSSDGLIRQWGTGHFIPVPRRIIMPYNSSVSPLSRTDLHKRLTTMVEYLGYLPQYHDLAGGLPADADPALHAGVIIWPRSSADYSTELEAWISRQLGRIPVMILGQPPSDSGLLKRFGAVATESSPPYQVEILDAPFRSEQPLREVREPVIGLKATDNGRSRLSVTDRNNQRLDQLITSDAGALVLSPWIISYLPDYASRWTLDPLALLTEAMKLKAIPAPDVTTENGRRILTVHIDGDGFPNKAQQAGTPYTAEVIHNDILNRYRLPTTVSVIEGEIGPLSKHRKESAKLEQIARNIFAEDYVELASHSFSHPFFWEAFANRRTIDESSTEYGFHLKIPGYKFNLAREISGSIDYINNRLAPADKQVALMLWTGDALPAADAISLARQNHVLNVNGGDSWVLNDNPTLSRIWPIGRHEGEDLYQIYAPVMNENVFTNLWKGPFSGYGRVIETFKITETPYRLKPYSIYYHFYSGDNPAGIKALHRAYQYVLNQPHTSLYLSDYAKRAEDFYWSAVSRDFQGDWHFNSRYVKTLRLGSNFPHPQIADGIAGYTETPQGIYVHLSSPRVKLSFKQTRKTPYLVSANIELHRWQSGDSGIEVSFTAHEAAELVIANARSCRFKQYRSIRRDKRQYLILPKGRHQGTILCQI
ncbi:endo alpha-1,4 polygalactosaminidase [Marinobacterium jannaschii]|uniref:endo alpha-1,4 polygalactosaminidase n=1 Tax=Marinobacterium jannaschii TaxID=64970 RepID=UPI000AC7A5A2|nr:endo alpha-1,4 polygalactosaminidase [Marinobacterium jannaschii]